MVRSQGSIKTLARNALTIIVDPKLNINSHGGAEKYLD